jgi:hypothetical protein
MTPQKAQLLRSVCWIAFKGFGLALILSALKGIWDGRIRSRWHSMARFETLTVREKNPLSFWALALLWLILGAFLLLTPLGTIIPGLQ